MNLRPEEISSIIRQQIEKYEVQVEVTDVGSVIQIGDGVARVYGLEDCMYSELLEFPGGVLGMALNLEEDNIGCVILGPYTHIKEGDVVKRTGRIASVPVGEGLIGRVINPVGLPLDGKGPLKSDKFRAIEKIAPGVVFRSQVDTPLQTGIKAIDGMIPIGRGQRELILGDRQTGKTAIAVDAIINQKGQDCICIYVAVGQKSSTIANVVQRLQDHGAMDYTIVVVAGASDPSPLLYIAPFAGAAIGEEFMESGKDVLIVYDDLTKQAAAYRELALLLRRPPGREAFPGDVFNLHSRLLERAAKLHPKYGGGSMTALPVIETQQGDLSAYIPTNVISITDGQIFLEPELFYAGVRPAVNVGLSVSRVGGKAQRKAIRQVAGQLKLELAQGRELAAFAQFGSDLDKSTLARLTRFERLTELLKQGQYVPMPLEEMVLSIFSGVRGYLDDIPVDKVALFEAEFLKFMRAQKPEIGATIKEKKEITSDVEAQVKSALDEFKKNFVLQHGAAAS